MDMHACETCGLQHAATGERAESDAVAIARIETQRDIEVARLQGRQERDWNETRVEVAEIEGAAEVATAEATAEVIGEVIAAEAGAEAEPPAEDPAPVVVTGPAEPEEELAPPETAPKESTPKKSSFWPYG
jgi:hypothetical protein